MHGCVWAGFVAVVLFAAFGLFSELGTRAVRRRARALAAVLGGTARDGGAKNKRGADPDATVEWTEGGCAWSLELSTGETRLRVAPPANISLESFSVDRDVWRRRPGAQCARPDFPS